MYVFREVLSTEADRYIVDNYLATQTVYTAVVW